MPAREAHEKRRPLKRAERQGRPDDLPPGVGVARGERGPRLPGIGDARQARGEPLERTAGDQVRPAVEHEADEHAPRVRLPRTGTILRPDLYQPRDLGKSLVVTEVAIGVHAHPVPDGAPETVKIAAAEAILRTFEVGLPPRALDRLPPLRERDGGRKVEAQRDLLGDEEGPRLLRDEPPRGARADHRDGRGEDTLEERDVLEGAAERPGCRCTLGFGQGAPGLDQRRAEGIRCRIVARRASRLAERSGEPILARPDRARPPAARVRDLPEHQLVVRPARTERDRAEHHLAGGGYLVSEPFGGFEPEAAQLRGQPAAPARGIRVLEGRGDERGERQIARRREARGSRVVGTALVECEAAGGTPRLPPARAG